MGEAVVRWGPVAGLLLVVLWLGWRVADLEGRLAAVETVQQSRSAALQQVHQRVEAIAARAPMAAARPAASSRAAPRPAPAALDLSAPGVREELVEMLEETQDARRREKKREWSEAWLASVREEVALFAEDNDLDPVTASNVIRTIEALHETRRALFADADAGAATWLEVKREMREAHGRTDAELKDLLGIEGHTELSERIPFGPGPR